MSRAANKNAILKALADNDISELRALSNYFYQTSGIYQKVCNYFATMYRFDWYVVPEVYDDKVSNEKIVADFNKVLNYLDNSYIKMVSADIALKVIKDGAYYGYAVMGPKGLMIQDLPASYCRSRYSVNSMPAIEFNMKFFDDKFRDINYRLKVLKMFPQEFAKGYMLYKQGKLPSDTASGTGSWYLLDPSATVKFSLGNGDVPLFVNALPAILDLDAAQDLDRRKQMQKLLKIIVQKLPLDKNGELIFDVDEAQDLHNNAVQMLSRAIGVDILTTFADIDSIDISDKNTLEQFVKYVIDKEGHIDYLINNAPPMMKGINECSFEEFNKALTVYTFFPFIRGYGEYTLPSVVRKLSRKKRVASSSDSSSYGIIA